MRKLLFHVPADSTMYYAVSFYSDNTCEIHQGFRNKVVEWKDQDNSIYLKVDPDDYIVVIAEWNKCAPHFQTAYTEYLIDKTLLGS